MYCRCRLLRAYHESLHSPMFVRPFLGVRRKYVSPAISKASDTPSPSYDDDNDDGPEPTKSKPDHTRGSTSSPLAFKPFTSHLLDLEESEPPELVIPSELDFLPQNSDHPTRKKNNYGEPWAIYVQHHRFGKKQKRRADAQVFESPKSALKNWNLLRSTRKLDGLSAVKWSVIGVAGCALGSADVVSHFAHDLVETYRKTPDVQQGMISKVLHRLLFPGGRQPSMKHYFALENFSEPHLPAPSPAGSSIKRRFQKHLDMLVISIFKEYYASVPERVHNLPHQLVFQLGLTAIRARSIDLFLHGPLLPTFLLKLQREAPTTSLAFPSLTPGATVIGPSPALFPIYCFIQHILFKKSERQALQIFQEVVKAGLVSSNAVSQVKFDGADLKEIILFALVRSCLDYEWVTGAFELLLAALEASPKAAMAKSGGTREAINETASLILKQVALMSLGPTFADTPQKRAVGYRIAPEVVYLFKRCLVLITSLRRTDNSFMLDDGVIQSFYKLAHQLNAGPLAEVLYNIGRYNLNSRYYPPPSSTPSFLTTPAFEQSPSTSVFQLSPIDPKYISFPPESPSSPLQDTGFTNSAFGSVLDLPKYPPPQGPALVWFMSYLTKTNKNVHLGRILAGEVADQGIDIPLLDRSKFLNLTASCGYAISTRKIWLKYSEDAKDGVIGHAGSMIRLVSLFSSLARKVPQREPFGGIDGEDKMPGTCENPGAEIVEAPHEPKQSFMQFAEAVISLFRRVKEPLEEAAHQDLNALVRAYFMTGQLSRGFDIFQIIMDRKEIPDLHDVNVALSGMAKYSPRMAEKMIERMIERGLLPDAVGFGTVIQEAILGGDTELVVGLVRRAREVDEGSLTFKTIAALVKASVSDVERSADADDKGGERRAIPLQMGRGGREGQLILGGSVLERVESNLKTAWKLIQTFERENVIGIPNLGEDCLRGALRIGQPDLAFKFWDSFLRKKTQWNDPEQVSLRRQIARLVQTSRNEGRLEGKKAKVMLGQLNASHLGLR